MPSYVTKGLYKIVAIALGAVRGAFVRAKLMLVWDIGRGCRFQGPVHVYSLGGNVTIGDEVTFGPHVNVSAETGATLTIGSRCSINQGSYVVAKRSIAIGNDVLIGEYVSIRDNDHEWRNPVESIRTQGFVTKPVSISDDVWVGRSAVISKGVTIGRGAVIGAGAVVTKDIPAYAIAVGNPARVIKHRG